VFSVHRRVRLSHLVRLWHKVQARQMPPAGRISGFFVSVLDLVQHPEPASSSKSGFLPRWLIRMQSTGIVDFQFFKGIKHGF
jgi:hypothetical protein